MQDRPTSTELLSAVREFLQKEILPVLNDHRQKFRTLIAANVLSVVERELAGEEGRLRAEWARLLALEGALPDQTTPPMPQVSGARDLQEGDHQRGARRAQPPAPATLDLLRHDVDARKRALCVRIRGGDADAGAWRRDVLAYARWALEEKLRVSNPRYLERLK
jgi:hypothetical protein